jgi:hypothetical protein
MKQKPLKIAIKMIFGILDLLSLVLWFLGSLGASSCVSVSLWLCVSVALCFCVSVSLCLCVWKSQNAAHTKDLQKQPCSWAKEACTIGWVTHSKKTIRWSCATSTLQRFLHYILAQYPVTACRVEFCLLCCQPGPMSQSLPARTPQFTLQWPCRLHAWPGRAIHMLCRTCKV